MRHEQADLIAALMVAVDGYAISCRNECNERERIQRRRPWPDDPEMAASHSRQNEARAAVEAAARALVESRSALLQQGDAEIADLKRALRNIPCLNELHEDDEGCEDLDLDERCIVCKEQAALEADSRHEEPQQAPERNRT